MEHYDVVVKCANFNANAMIMSSLEELDIMTPAFLADFVSLKAYIALS